MDRTENKSSDKKNDDLKLEGISMSSGKEVFKPVQTSYLDSIHNTAQDRKDIKKEKNKILSKKDKTEIRILAILNAAVFVFMGVYIALTGADDEYESIKEEARFYGDSSLYLSADEFAQSLEPTLSETEFPIGMQKSFRPLYSENHDTAGWISIPGTNIDHVILQGKTNEDYSRHNFYNQYVIQGSIFMDYRNVLGNGSSTLSKNTILYGHYMQKQRTMFTALENYKELDYYKQHPIIEMSTIYSSYKWKIIGAFVTTVDAQHDGGNIFYYWYDNFSDNSTLSYANEVAFRSYIVNPSIDIQPTDKFLTLSTCNHMMDIDGVVNARLVVVGRLIREGESEDVNVDAAYVNENRRMPQLWYDQQGLENPYSNYAVWDPFG